MDNMDATINRIALLINFDLSLEEIHDRVCPSSFGVSEEDFYLAYKAAEILAPSLVRE